MSSNGASRDGGLGGAVSPRGRGVGRARIAVADARAIVRLGLRTLIERQADLAFAGEAEDCQGLLFLMAETAVDLVVVDLDLPDARGAELLRKLREQFPDAALLAFGSQKDSASVLLSIRAGAKGYLTREAATAQIIEAIRIIRLGDTYLDPRVAAQIIDLAGGTRDTRRRSQPVLTERERAVLNLLAAGKRNKDISEILFISEHTVKFHLTGLLQKLQANNRTDVVTKALNMGLISL